MVNIVIFLAHLLVNKKFILNTGVVFTAKSWVNQVNACALHVAKSAGIILCVWFGSSHTCRKFFTPCGCSLA